MTTYREYITRKVAAFQMEASDVEDLLLEAGLDGDAEADIRTAQLAMWQCFDDLLRSTLANINEGGMSISWNIEAIKQYYSLLCSKLGKRDYLTPAPRLRDRSNIW